MKDYMARWELRAFAMLAGYALGQIVLAILENVFGIYGL